ncbi:3,4-dihydroxyphenylacetaldehyde synthase 2-like [Pectinophora gossypiella]|uniref:3,4-dihydroxyphenylacetaldehyde synthase 2-like n=1 Tax=Pectinophora gossypiella TaxID=13191 RepID=UPI00214EB77C|nr:3,4-dihydroxyphenylacetaldehyde synthase 2-like [Pectinophora gossypiella]
MDVEEFREFGKAAIDLIADYMENIRARDVLPSVEPGYLVNSLPPEAPEEPEQWKDVLHDFTHFILPGITHWHSPRFHAFYPTGTSFASLVGSILSNGLGVIGFSWMSSPACTELEVVTMNWLGKLLGLPEQFLNCSTGPGGGVIQGSASEATLVGLLAAKDRTVRRIKQTNPDLDEGFIKAKLIAYSSDQSNSSVEKAGLLGSMKMRLLKTDADGKLRGDTLKKAFEEDQEQGLIPCYCVATLGTTGTCAFDPLYEIGPLCNEYNVWLHVDAAYAGAAFTCPEYRHLMNGVEYVDSFDVNAHKWMLVNFDCSCMWVKNGYDLIKTFDVQRIYLDDLENSNKIPDYRHWQLPLGRKFRALKLWTVLRIYGTEGIRSHIRNQIGLAKYFAQLMQPDDRFVIEPEPAMGLVCFRLTEGDKVTKKLLDNLTEKKKVFMVAGSYHNRYMIRFVICSRNTKKEDVDYSWNKIKEEVDCLCPVNIHTKKYKVPVMKNIDAVKSNEKSK